MCSMVQIACSVWKSIPVVGLQTLPQYYYRPRPGLDDYHGMSIGHAQF